MSYNPFVVDAIVKALQSDEVLSVDGVTVGPYQTAISQGEAFAVIDDGRAVAYSLPTIAAEKFIDMVGIVNAKQSLVYKNRGL